MDKGTQEKVTRISEQDKQTVLNFIDARMRGKIKIESFIGLENYLNSTPFRQLWPKENRPQAYWTDSDAEKYFHFLIAVLKGTREASDEDVREAVGQLYECISVLREEIETDEDFVVSLKSEEKLGNIEKRLETTEADILNVNKKLDSEISKFAAVLKAINDWRGEFQPTLNEARDYFLDKARRMQGT